MARLPQSTASRAAVLISTLVGVLLLVLLLNRGEERPGALPGAPRALAAAAFTDSVGVNVHLTYYDTSYGRFQNWRALLRNLGVRHIRDGLVTQDTRFVTNLSTLGRDGIRASLIGGETTGNPDAQLSVVAGPLRQAVQSIELTNEPDQSDGPNWLARLRSYLPRLKRAVQSRAPGIPLLGPSFVRPESRQLAAALSGEWQIDNIHPYPGGQEPARPADLARLDGRRPVWATETGYHNAVDSTVGQPGVPEDVAAAYIPRLLAENLDAGIPRTYLYELLDEKVDPSGRDPEQHFGLVRQDLTPKPSFGAVRNLLRQVAATPGAGPKREAKAMRGDPTVRQMLLHRADGSSVLLLWRRVPLWDTPRKEKTNPDAVPIRVDFAGQAHDVRIGYPSREALTTTRPDSGSVTPMVGGDLVTISFR